MEIKFHMTSEVFAQKGGTITIEARNSDLVLWKCAQIQLMTRNENGQAQTLILGLSNSKLK